MKEARPLMRLVTAVQVLGAATLLVGCSPPEPACEPNPLPGPGPVRTVSPDLALVGAPTEALLTVRAARPDTCGSPAEPVRYELDVFDPANLPVEAELIELDNEEFSVTFTPQSAGMYFIDLRRSNPAGSAQREVFAATDRRGAPRATISPSCKKVASTASGARVCDSEVYVDETLAATLPDYDLVGAAGASLWLISGSSLQRWVHGASGVIASPAASVSTSVVDWSIPSFTEDEALLISGTFIERYRVVGDSLVQVGAVDRASEEFGTRWIHRMGDLAFTFKGNETANPLEVCAWSLPADGSIVRTATPCQTLQGRIVAANANEVWTREQPPIFGDEVVGTLLRRYVRSGEMLVSVNTTTVPSSIGVVAPADVLPEIGGELAFIDAHNSEAWIHARSVDGGLALELFSDSRNFIAARPGTLWLSQDGGTSIIEP